MTRSMNAALALLAVLVSSGCSSQNDSSTNPQAGGSGTGGGAAGSGMGGAAAQSGSGLAGATGTGTARAGAPGTSASGTGASGTGASGAGGSATGAAGAAGGSGKGTGGDSTSGAGGTTGAAGSAPPMRGECVGDWKAGTYPDDFITGGGMSTLPAIGGRNYAVHVPKGYDCQVPTPIVYGLHGLGMSGYSFNVAGTSTPKRPGGLVAKADEEGFILVMTTGLGPAAADVQVVKDIFKNLETHLNIDHKRVYATGHSFGGALSFLLACTAADLFTAVAPNAWTMLSGACTPAQPISVLASNGTADGIAPPGDVKASMNAFATADGCSAMEMPATVPASGSDTACVTRVGCKGGFEVTTCTIKDGGHVWFGDPTCGTGADACDIVGKNSDYYVNTDFAWDFLKRLSR
jgi:poly(3-hydroxybutyrate) depolymerase